MEWTALISLVHLSRVGERSRQVGVGWKMVLEIEVRVGEQPFPKPGGQMLRSTYNCFRYDLDIENDT